MTFSDALAEQKRLYHLLTGPPLACWNTGATRCSAPMNMTHPLTDGDWPDDLETGNVLHKVCASCKRPFTGSQDRKNCRMCQGFNDTVEAAVAKAASTAPDTVTAPSGALVLLPNAADPLGVADGVMNAMRARITAKRMEQVEVWLHAELAKHLPAETMALPAEERIAAIQAAGFYGAEPRFKGQYPMVTNMALYRRRAPGQPGELIAAMKFEPFVSSLDKIAPGS